MKRSSKTKKRLKGSIVAVIVLAICLCITTYAIVWASVSVNENVFQTGKVQINLNGGEPVINEQDFLFEPGMTVQKEFFIENKSTCDVYYKLYFTNAEGGLADVLEITIHQKDGNELYHGTAASLSSDKAAVDNDALGINERRNLTILFHYPENADNSGQARTLTFNLCADAVQTKNNPQMLFD
ncbi:MAG: hypothetical protein KIG21_05405 [Angelakisella sp.]|nr:hypothetical protein [Angelakisella sp.]